MPSKESWRKYPIIPNVNLTPYLPMKELVYVPLHSDILKLEKNKYENGDTK